MAGDNPPSPPLPLLAPSHRRRRLPVKLVATVLLGFAAVGARAEYVVFKDGRHMKVSSVTFAKGEVEVSLETGGWIRFDADQVRYVTTDSDVEAAPAPPPPQPEDPPWMTWADPRFVTNIRAAASAEGIDAGLVAAVIKIESDFRPHAVSPKGARGLMQLMPATASSYGVTDPFDPAANIAAGVKHLKGLLDRFQGEARLALAAYNAGEGAVKKHKGVPPYKETQRYVEQILTLWKGAPPGA